MEASHSKTNDGSTPTYSEVSASELKKEATYFAVFGGNFEKSLLEKFTCVNIEEVELCDINGKISINIEVIGKISGYPNHERFMEKFYKFYELK
jgi:hypothetical protein